MDLLRRDWNRYDTLGRTYYLAESPECAYSEVLAQFKRANGASDPLEPVARVLNLTLEETVRMIAQDWGEEDFHNVGALPPTWRSERRLYEARLVGGGWLVDVQHPDSIAALEEADDGRVAQFLANNGIPSLTVSTLTSENRTVTTMLAETIRDDQLDDGWTPRGVHFGSKHGGAWCKAVWLPYAAASPSGIEITKSTHIEANDSAFRTVLRRFRLCVLRGRHALGEGGS
ncbi:MAG: hypothetical protein ABI310_05260 [Microbacteriaceae bacterium]